MEAKSKKVCRPEGWEEVDGVKQAAAGEECTDGTHEDVCVEVEVELPVLGKRKEAEVEVEADRE